MYFGSKVGRKTTLQMRQIWLSMRGENQKGILNANPDGERSVPVTYAPTRRDNWDWAFRPCRGAPNLPPSRWLPSSMRSPTLFQDQGGAKHSGQIGNAAGTASPHRQHLPSLPSESTADPLVAFPVCLNLVRPEFSSRGRQS
jgi:hypothetical protein